MIAARCPKCGQMGSTCLCNLTLENIKTTINKVFLDTMDEKERRIVVYQYCRRSINY